MMKAHQFLDNISRRARLGLCALALLGSFVLYAPDLLAADNEPSAARLVAELVEQQRIDQAMGAFNLPVLIRLRASVSPTWPGPRGLPPFTQRTNCPEPVGPGLDFC